MSITTDTAKEPATRVLAGPYGHPFHPILVTVPIGAWISSLVFDIGSHIVSDPGFLFRGAYWLIAIGVVGAVAAAAIGLLDFVMIPRHTTAFQTALTHMTINLVVTAIFVIDFAMRLNSDTYDQPVRGSQTVLTIVALALLGVSGFLGGKLAYGYGVRVAAESAQREGFVRD